MSVDKNREFTGLILVSGVDEPGITSKVLSKLAEFSVQIIDIKQIVTADRLLQTILINLLPDHALAVESDLQELASNSSFDVAIDFSQHANNQEQLEHAYISMVDLHLDPKKIATVARYIYQIKANILDIKLNRLSDLNAITFQIGKTGLNHIELQDQLKEIGLAEGIDLCLTSPEFQKVKKLFVFDMDSTLIKEEVIDLLAVKANKGEEVSKITAMAMNGELDFEQSLRQRVALLAGLPESVLKETTDLLSFNSGVIETLKYIKEMGHKVAVVSGGFTQVIEKFLAQVEVDYVFANTLDIANSTLTGKLTGEIIDGSGKAESMRKAAQLESIPLSNTIAIGDGANDLKMMAAAGYSFAYLAKEVVRQGAKSTISQSDMRALPLLLNL